MTTNSPNPVDGDVQALIMSQKEMQDFANIYRSDNDRGTYAWFDASLANWSEGFLSPKVFEHIFDQQSATKWLDKEIENFIDDGRCPSDYVYLKSNPALNPVIVVFYEGKAVIWDGYHRIAAAVHRNMPVYAIFTTPPAQLLRPVELPHAYSPALSSVLKNSTDGVAVMRCDKNGKWINKTAVIETLRQQGYEVKS